MDSNSNSVAKTRAHANAETDCLIGDPVVQPPTPSFQLQHETTPSTRSQLWRRVMVALLAQCLTRKCRRGTIVVRVWPMAWGLRFDVGRLLTHQGFHYVAAPGAIRSGRRQLAPSLLFGVSHVCNPVTPSCFLRGATFSSNKCRVDPYRNSVSR